MIKTLLRHINNLKLSNKLLVIYILCVLLPITIGNLIFYTNLRDQLKENEIEKIKFSINRMSEEFARTIQEIVSVSDVFYNDMKLNEDLETVYTEFSDYSIEYNTNLKYSVSKFYAIYSQIKEITIYTDNPTIVVTGGYHPLGEPEFSSHWFKAYKESEKNIYIFYDSETRIISLIRKLDNFKNSSYYQKYLKIDFRKESIDLLLRGENLKGNIRLITNTNKLVGSSNYSEIDFQNSKENLTIIKTFENSKYFKEWFIEGIFTQKSIVAELEGAGSYILKIMLFYLIIASSIILLISKSLSYRIKILKEHMDFVEINEYKHIFIDDSKDEIGSLIYEFNKMVDTIKSLIKNVYESSIIKQKMEIEMKQSQINALQSQINPHFLFNTFESIQMRCIIKDENETAEIIQALSMNFRRMISWDDDLVSIHSEIEFIEAFLKIQQYRFKDKIEYSISVDTNCLDYKIPKMTIQPLVENAIEHGIAKKKGIGNITIFIALVGEVIECKVTDNGIGMSLEKLKALKMNLLNSDGTGNSIGLKNVYSRLQLIYGNTNFNIVSQLNHGTVITFEVPINHLG